MGDSPSAAQIFLEQRPEYTMEGVVSFLRTSALCHDQEASEWARDRRQLHERVQALEQRCEAHRHVEEDLVRRIKMLEFALERERQGRAVLPQPEPSAARPRQHMGTVVMGKKKKDPSEERLFEETFVHPIEEEVNAAAEAAEGLSLADFFSPAPGEIRPENSAGAGDAEERQQSWALWAGLRSHLDGLRAVAFSSSGTVLVSASDDASLKLWVLKAVKIGTKDGTVTADLEPSVTLRGHVGAVTCAIIEPSPRAETCYSAGLDGTVRVWAVPSSSQDLYDSVGASIRQQVHCIRGHSDAVWGLCAHPSEPLLFSASADATVRVWDTREFSERQRLSAPGEDRAARVPTCVQLHHSALLAAYTDGALVAFDLASETHTLLFSHGAGAACNAVSSHPSLGAAGAACEDGVVRLFDVGSGKVVWEMPAHQGAATSIAIDPSGLYAASGGTDGVVKIWDLRRQACVHQFSSEGQRCLGEGITGVAYHPTRPLLACAAASSAVNMYIRTSA